MASVFVKGIGKVFFPDSMGQKEIADTLTARSQELLDMSTAARMQRAKDQGFPIDDPVFSGSGSSPEDRVQEILPLGRSVTSEKKFINNQFGGIFGSKDKGVASSFGDDVMEIVSNKPHIDADEFVQVADMDEFKRVIEEHRGETLTAEEADELFDYIVSEGKSPFDDVPDMGVERLEEIMGAIEPGEMSWAFQGLKGELARRQGFGSVGMLDETGESILMLTGRNLARAAFDPARKGSRDLLAGAGAGLATAAGTLFTPEDNKALADQGLSHLIPTGDTIQPDEFPRLERAADFIDEYTQTPFGPAFEGISQYLRGFGEDSEGKDKAKRAMMAALDLL